MGDTGFLVKFPKGEREVGWSAEKREERRRAGWRVSHGEGSPAKKPRSARRENCSGWTRSRRLAGSRSGEHSEK